jgi:hypothetical protein
VSTSSIRPRTWTEPAAFWRIMWNMASHRPDGDLDQLADRVFQILEGG